MLCCGFVGCCCKQKTAYEMSISDCSSVVCSSDLDGSVSPLRVLPQIVRACPEVPVMMDSGIRRGSDAVKALALGARFVFVCRPFNYAAAIGGEAGDQESVV